MIAVGVGRSDRAEVGARAQEHCLPTCCPIVEAMKLVAAPILQAADSGSLGSPYGDNVLTDQKA
jgi:hypothetical protein